MNEYKAHEVSLSERKVLNDGGGGGYTYVRMYLLRYIAAMYLVDLRGP